MTLEQQIVLKLIRSAVSGSTCEIPSNTRWQEVMDIATSQGVLGICFDAMELLSADQRPGMDELMDWLGQVSFMESCYEEHKRTMAELAEFYNSQCIRMMVLKGYGLSLYWPKPNHRPVGDLDTFNFGKHEAADALVKDVLHIEIDNSHHKHSVFNYKGVTVENHFSFLNAHGHRSTAEIETILEDEVRAESLEVREDCEIKNLYYPSVKFNSLYLLRHSGEHFASVDMNLRQVLDWGFFVRANAVDWEWLLKTLNKVGMKDYLAVLNAICVRYLGFDKALFPELPVDDALVERSINDILHPEVEKEHHQNTVREIAFRFKRWWKNGWKHDMVYRESKWQSLMTQMWSHVLKPTL